VKAVVVYESLWGNTAAIARAIAEGLGEGARALSTAEAVGAALADVALIVAGAPVLGFRLPTEAMRQSVLTSERNAPTPPDLSHPSMRSWLDALPNGQGRSAAFETRIWWSPGGAIGPIADKLERAGYPRLTKARRFVVKGKYGPLRDGELERARRWGAELAQAMG
jgi:flavorubredoxin